VLFKAGSAILTARSGADKPRFLTLSKSRPGGNPKALNIIALGIAKFFLCFSKLEAPFFQEKRCGQTKGTYAF
jgi:hypothetical protein